MCQVYHGLLTGSIVFSHQFHRNKIHSHLLTNPSAFAMINVDKGEEEEEYIHSSFREGFSQAGRKPKDAWMEGSFGAGYLNGSDRTVGHPGVVPVIERRDIYLSGRTGI